MQTRDLPEEAPGHYRESHPHPYYIPDKLPLSTRIDADDELTELIANASFQLGRINGISPTVDFSPILYTSLVRLEAVETAEIEGADVDVDEVYAHHTRTSGDENVDVSRDLQEVLNAEPLDDSYEPEDIRERDEELEKYQRALQPIIDNRPTSNIFL